MKSKSLLRDQKSVALQEDPAATFPYGLWLNVNLQDDNHSPIPTRGTSKSAARVTNSKPHFETMETYIRFPLTKCHHLIPFNMPRTFLDESSDNVLPCGCWIGKAPDVQIQEATLFVDYVGAEGSFKSVWDVTGLGSDGCWECGALEHDIIGEIEARADTIEKGYRYSHTAGAHTGVKGTQRVDEEADKVMSIQEAFLKECKRWQQIEDWKDKWWDGDIAERGTKMVADSRWTKTAG